jgi:ubiquinone/menaquinone biosynthesis C-methylase UbiE
MTNRATQPELLEQRIAENSASQEVDLVKWIFDRLSGGFGSVLELCCGTGAQTLPMLRIVGNGGTVVALDVSQEALAALTQRAQGERASLQTVCGSLDDLSAALQSLGLARPSFDLIFCAYGLYYSSDARKILDEALSWLNKGGRIAVIGPFGPNNGPLFDLVRACGAKIPAPVIASSESFMTDLVVPWAGVKFKSIRISTLVNTVRWPTPVRVLNYWQNTTFYSSEHRGEFEQRLAQHFARHKEFVNEKWVMMVEMTDARS